MGISSTGSGRPFPLGPTPVPTRPPARGSPVLRALRMGSSEAALGRSAPLPARPRAGARCGTVYPSGGPGSYEASGRSAPLPRLPGGGPHFSREMGRKRAGGKPPGPPGFMARLLPLARFGVCATLSRSWGYFAAHLRTLIWGLSFIKCFFSIFSPENASQIGFGIPEEIAVLPYQSQPSQKPASGNERL